MRERERGGGGGGGEGGGAINRRETRGKVSIRDTTKTQRRHIGDT
jgi:hypothetical protein